MAKCTRQGVEVIYPDNMDCKELASILGSIVIEIEGERPHPPTKDEPMKVGFPETTQTPKKSSP